MKKNQIFFLTIIGLILMGMSSCTKYTNRIKGSGPVVKETYDLPAISAVSLDIDANVILTHGDSQTVVIEGQSNIIYNIEKYVSNEGMWVITYNKNVTNHAGVTIFITSPHIDYATISGSGNIEASNHFPDSTNVYLGISGSGNIAFSADAYILESVISGSGQIYVSGSAFEQNINISGSGNVRSFGLETKNSYIRISGSGNSEITCLNYMNADISGSGSVFYKGDPDIEANISGSGTIVNRN